MESRKYLQNPILSEDFTVTYGSKTDDPKTFSIPAGEIVEIPQKYFDFVSKHLYDFVINERNLNGILINANPNEKKKLLNEIIPQI